MATERATRVTTSSRKKTSIAVHGSSVASDLEGQLRFMAEEGLSLLELGRVGGAWCSDLSPEQLDGVATACAAAGVEIFSVRSALGLSAEPAENDWDHMSRCARNARHLGARYVLIQSYWRRVGGGGARDRFSFISSHLVRLLMGATRGDVIFCVRNVAGTTCETSIDLMRLIETVGSPRLRAVFDPANAALVGEVAYCDGFPLLAPYIAYLHGRDFDPGAGIFVPPGEGVCQWTRIAAHEELGGPIVLDFSMTQVGDDTPPPSLTRARAGVLAARGLLAAHREG